MVRIGDRSVLAAYSLLIPAGERANIELDAFGWSLKVSIVFDDGPAEQSIEVRPAADGVELVFRRWTNPLGSALAAPGLIATLAAGGRIEFMAANYRIVDTNHLEIQFLHKPDAG